MINNINLSFKASKFIVKNRFILDSMNYHNINQFYIFVKYYQLKESFQAEFSYFKNGSFFRISYFYHKSKQFDQGVNFLALNKNK